nr:hypothetical protein [Tanacetum cinerariifolium]
MVAYLSKSIASAGFNQIVDFLNTQVIQYALKVNPSIYVSCIKQFWAMASIKKANDVVNLRALIDGKMQRGMRRTNSVVQWRLLSSALLQVESSTSLMDDLSSHTNQYTSTVLTQKVFANMRRVGMGFSRVETPLFASMLVQPQVEVKEDDVEVHVAPTPPSPTIEPLPPLQDSITTPLQAQPAPPSSPPHEQQTDTSESSMTLLNTLIETCATLSQKVAQLKQDKISQALEILKLKKRVKKLEKKRRSKSSGLKRLRKKRKDDDNASTKEMNAVEPTVFDDEEVAMTMAQTLINMKSKKARLLDEQMAKRLHDEEERHFDNIRKYLSHKRKPVSMAQTRKNMIIYLKNMAGYKMEHFKGMTYDKVRPIFEREHNKVQTLFKPDKDVEEPQKKRVAKETLRQVSFKKLKAVEVLGSVSTQDTPTNDPKKISEEDVQNMLEIVLVSEFKKSIRVGGITESYKSFEDMLKGFDKEDLDALWRLVKEKISITVPTVDKEKALWVELKRLSEPDTDDVIWKLQRYMHYPITWKLYSNYGVHQRFGDENLHGGQKTKEKKFGYILQVIKKLELKKLDVLLAEVDAVQRLEEKALRD